MGLAMYESVLLIETSLPLGITLPEYRRARCTQARRRTFLRRLAGFVAA
jgi:hypothetical protein